MKIFLYTNKYVSKGHIILSAQTNLCSGSVAASNTLMALAPTPGHANTVNFLNKI